VVLAWLGAGSRKALHTFLSAFAQRSVSCLIPSVYSKALRSSLLVSGRKCVRYNPILYLCFSVCSSILFFYCAVCSTLYRIAKCTSNEHVFEHTFHHRNSCISSRSSRRRCRISNHSYCRSNRRRRSSISISSSSSSRSAVFTRILIAKKLCGVMHITTKSYTSRCRRQAGQPINVGDPFDIIANHAPTPVGPCPDGSRSLGWQGPNTSHPTTLPQILARKCAGSICRNITATITYMMELCWRGWNCGTA
jgi:hypothetical protein